METTSLKTVSPNFARVQLSPSLAIWFSYETPIAFEFQGIRVRRRNDWGPITGKHLHSLDGGDKASRLDPETFKSKLNAVLGWECQSR